MVATVNVLLDTFPGLSLPSTVCLPLPATTQTDDLLSHIQAFLPHDLPSSTRLILSTASNKQICRGEDSTIADLACGKSDRTLRSASILSLRLSVPLCGGKGGFGSQLRAAGGRMSSRKRRQNAELATGSARNLDGRRLRTITEAKNLAAYLATKPEMDRKEKEERRKRWEQVVELAEQREADMRAGKGADGRRKGLSEEWIEEKDEVGENVRNAVKMAMMANQEKAEVDESSGSGGSRAESEDDESDGEDPMELDDEEMARLRAEAEGGDADAIWVLKNKLKIPSQYLPRKKPKRHFAGFDDDDDDEDDSSEEDRDTQGEASIEPGSKVAVEAE